MKDYLSLAVILAMVLMITSCLPLHGEDIPFETVIQIANADSRAYFEPKPKIAVATSSEEVDKLKALLSPNDWDALQNIDLSTDLVIAAFQGRKQTGGYKIEVVSVKQSGNQVYVIANFVTPTPGKPVTTLMRSPYHVIKVKKANLKREGRITFILMNISGRAVAKTVHEVR